MKQFKTLLFAAILVLGTTSFVNAQSKVAHIDTQELVTAMPEYKAAMKELEQLSTTYQNLLKDKAQKLETKMKQYDAEAASKTDEDNAKRLQEVQKDEYDLRQDQAKYQQELQKKEYELLKIITESAKATILKVGKSKGFEYVLDSSEGSSVIMAEGTNLMGDVKKELGIN